VPPAVPANAGPDGGAPAIIKKLIIRSIVGFFMIFGFAILLIQDHEYICVFVVLIQILVFKELIVVRYKAVKEKNLWGFRTQQWYFLGITLFFFYGKAVLNHFSKIIKDFPPAIYDVTIHHHNWISFLLYIVGFCVFIFSLRRSTLKYQLGQMTWTVMTLLLVVVQSHVITTAIFEGRIWLILPSALIICNDIMAYFMGLTFGRRFSSKPLTRLSPNKTWEGFIGAFFWTLVFAYFISGFMSQYDFFVCPVAELRTPPLGQCKHQQVFVAQDFSIPEFLVPVLQKLGFQGIATAKVHMALIQLHSLVFAVFASFIAPFGGFFMSAVKRAYKIKDFDNIFPGHGGMTDRMDCQLIIGLFTFVYYTTFIRPLSLSTSQLLSSISGLPRVDQLVILDQLQLNLNDL